MTATRTFPDAGEWLARWIEPVEADSSRDVYRPAYHLAGEVTVGGDVASATLHITAHGIYEAFVNGTRIGDLHLTPGFTAYQQRLQVHSFDITDLVRSGANAVGATLSDGWWRGQHGIVRGTNSYGETTALLAELHVELVGGVTIVWGTDASWRSTPSHIVAADLIAGEAHDHTRRVPGWAEPGTDRTRWDPVTLADHGDEELVALSGPPTRAVEKLPARSVKHVASRCHVVDFGQNSNGWIRLTDLGPAGTDLTITYGEVLGEDGRVDQSNIGASMLAPPHASPSPFQTDHVISAGDGSSFEPSHSTKGFRFVQIDGHPGPIDPAAVTSVVVHTDLRAIGAFACSDERINRFHRAAVWSFRGNACEIPTDCPTRERAGWTGDWQLYVATAAELYDVTDWSARWLADLAAEQWPDGTVTNIVPDPNPHAPIWGDGQGSSGWGDAAVHVPWELYRATGRTDLLEAQLDSMRAWVDFAAATAANGRHPGRVERHPDPLPHERYLWDTGWHFGEWLEPGADMDNLFAELFFSDHGAVATAYLYRSADELARIGAVLGRADVAATYGDLAVSVRDAWRTEFIDEDGGIRPHTQANLVRGLAFGLVPDELREQTADELVDLIRDAGTHLGTGFLATPFLLPVLADSGHLDAAYELLLRDDEPSWLHMTEMGSTTVWEDWDAVHDDGRVTHSLNHYSKGAVISFLHRYTAGVQGTEPGYRAFRVAPQPGGGITSASYHHDAPAGRISVEWHGTTEGGDITVIVPDGSTATLVMPGCTSEPLDAGTHRREW